MDILYAADKIRSLDNQKGYQLGLVDFSATELAQGHVHLKKMVLYFLHVVQLRDSAKNSSHFVKCVDFRAQ